MGSRTWERLDSAFFGALELPLGERPAYLDRVCGEDPDLRRRVEDLLLAHYAASGTDGLTTGALAGEEGPGAPVVGSRIGAYEVEALIGRGGMGEVYRARRADAQYEQWVAIKLMRPGRDSADLVRRFRTERQILARLQHPNIATLLDGGVTEEGRPYLVLQYVDGVPITQYANREGLGLAARLQLFLTVCEAAQFAHSNLVVHRDLKPNNILVSRNGDVRLLDFGVAKLLDAEPWAGSATGDLLLLTPEHAAPEQFLGSPITTATDVYALGVLLYEMLAGSRPFQSTSPLELHRAVCEEVPPAPSQSSRDPARLAAGKLERAPVAPDEIRGDLDSIVMQAIRKEPERRYRTVGTLADDVRSYLAGFPVSARPETFGYVAGRFLRRHRGGVAAATALTATLAALAIVSVRFAVTSRAQARAVAEERDVAVRVSEFLETLFEAPDPFAIEAGRRDTLRIKDFLDQGTRKVQDELRDDPRLRGRMLTVLGRAYSSLGQAAAATPLLEEAVEIRREALGPLSIETAASERALANALFNQGDPAGAESLLRSVDSILQRAPGATGADRLKTLGSLGNALQAQGRLVEAEDAYRRALSVAEATFPAGSAEIAFAMGNLANSLRSQAKLDEAEPMLREALSLYDAALGPDHPRATGILNNLGSLLLDRNQNEAAEIEFRHALDILRDLPPHPNTTSVMANHAIALLRLNRRPEAEAELREVLRMQREMLGEQHPAVARTLLNLASMVDDQEEPDRALALKTEARDAVVIGFGAANPIVASAEQNLGVTLHHMNRHREALARFERALAISVPALGATHPLTASVQSKAGLCAFELGRNAEAEAYFQGAFATFEPIKERAAREWDSLLVQLTRLYRAQGRTAEADRYDAMR